MFLLFLNFFVRLVRLVRLVRPVFSVIAETRQNAAAPERGVRQIISCGVGGSIRLPQGTLPTPTEGVLCGTPESACRPPHR